MFIALLYFHLPQSYQPHRTMQGITRLLSSSIRLSMMRKNIALTSTTCKTNTIYDPNFLVADSPSSCCLRCISDQSRKRRKSSQKFDWEREHSFNDETAVEEDTEIFSDEGRTRYHFMLKGFGVMCYIFFCNLGYFIRLKLRELKKADIPKDTWRDSVYWRNKTLTGFMTLSYVLGKSMSLSNIYSLLVHVTHGWLSLLKLKTTEFINAPFHTIKGRSQCYASLHCDKHRRLRTWNIYDAWKTWHSDGSRVVECSLLFIGAEKHLWIVFSFNVTMGKPSKVWALLGFFFIKYAWTLKPFLIWVNFAKMKLNWLTWFLLAFWSL